MPRFVILEHDHPFLHWDLMLEAGSVLQTWRLALPPVAGHLIPATYLSEHRLMYLDYEGPVSGGRGRVVRWDSGSFTGLTQTAGNVEVELAGNRVWGKAVLEQINGQEWSFLLTDPRANA
jgi:hypothetical protein